MNQLPNEMILTILSFLSVYDLHAEGSHDREWSSKRWVVVSG